jgi:hypothetical protein
MNKEKEINDMNKEKEIKVAKAIKKMADSDFIPGDKVICIEEHWWCPLGHVTHVVDKVDNDPEIFWVEDNMVPKHYPNRVCQYKKWFAHYDK